MAIEAGPVALGGNASRPGIGRVKWPCWRYPSVIKYGTWNSTITGSVTGKILWWSMFYCHVWHQRVHIMSNHLQLSFLIFLTCSVFLPFTNFHDGWQLRCTASFWQSGLGGMADVITFNAALSRALGKLRLETTGVTRVRRVVSSHGNHLPLKIVIQNHWRWSSKDDPHQVAPEELGFYGISWDFQIFIPPHSWIFVAGCDFFRASLAIRRMCESLRLCLPDLPGDRSQESPRFIEFPGFHKLQYQIWGSKYIKMEQHESIYVLCLQKLSPWESILDPKIIPMCSFPQEMEMRQLDPVPQRIPQKLEFGSRGSWDITGF